jgi:hypothetical protein
MHTEYDRDYRQKESFLKIFWQWGGLPQLEIRLLHPEASGKTLMELTDIDVHSIVFTESLDTEKYIADCKTLKMQSPINRAFWMKGIMEYIRSNKGYVVVPKTVSEDHKLAAYSMGITLFSDGDFKVFVGKALPSTFPHKMKMFDYGAWKYLESNLPKLKGFARILDYRKHRFWIDNPARRLRYSLLEVRDLKSELDSSQKHHKALVLDMVTLFSVAFQEMIGRLFHLHLLTDDKQSADSYLKTFIYGGRETYTYFNQLSTTMQKLKFQSTPTLFDKEIQDLSLPEWERFLQLYRTVIENPVEIRNIPRFLRFILFERLLYDNSEVSVKQAIPDIDTISIKLSLDIVEYFSIAADLPSDFTSTYKTMIEQILLSESKQI